MDFFFLLFFFFWCPVVPVHVELVNILLFPTVSVHYYSLPTGKTTKYSTFFLLHGGGAFLWSAEQSKKSRTEKKAWPVAPVAQRYHVTSDTLGREFDPGKRDFSH